VRPSTHHPWNVTPREAVAIQERLRSRVIRRNRIGRRVRRVAGVDVAFEDSGRITRAAVVVLCWPGLETVDSAVARTETSFPYVPGLLSFRELPAVLEAIRGLNEKPDLWLCDGQGIAHPRRFGIASHLGVLLDAPTIGVGKSRLIGEHDEVGWNRGNWVPLTHEGERVGAVLRTRDKVNPVYISVGHRIALHTAVNWVLRCAPRYRLPETTRQADRLAGEKR
jgi:deoxyribonuclease V